MPLSDLKAPGTGEWVEHSDERRTLLLHGGPISEPVATLDRRGWEGFELLTTERALTAAAELGEAATAVHLVADLPVDEASAALVDSAEADRIVAMGGGRVIDAAKAVASVTHADVAAIPTTLSGAPITGFHRLPRGRESDVSGFVRPTLVIGYSDAMTSAPERQLRATAMNALAHGADSLFTPRADPISRQSTLRGAALIASTLDQPPGERNRAELALGAMLCAIAVDLAGFALHHVLGQTTVRVLGVPHAETYAALLPRTMEAMRARAPEQIEALAEALGTNPDRLAGRIDELGGGRRIGQLGADRERLEEVLDGAMARPELEQMTPGEVKRSELAGILEAAW
jgi:alcohol dehydrogenase class IV